MYSLHDILPPHTRLSSSSSHFSSSWHLPTSSGRVAKPVSLGTTKKTQFLQSVQMLLESVVTLLEDESRVLVAAEVAKLATLLVMALVAYKKLSEFLCGVQHQTKAFFNDEQQAVVSAIGVSVHELHSLANECHPDATPTNGLLLELSLLEFGSKSLNPSDMNKQLALAGGKIVVGIVKTALKGGMPDASIWTGLRDAAVALRDGADQAVATAVFLTGLYARYSSMSLTKEVATLTRRAKEKVKDIVRCSIVRCSISYQQQTTRPPNHQQKWQQLMEKNAFSFSFFSFTPTPIYFSLNAGNGTGKGCTDVCAQQAFRRLPHECRPIQKRQASRSALDRVAWDVGVRGRNGRCWRGEHS